MRKGMISYHGITDHDEHSHGPLFVYDNLPAKKVHSLFTITSLRVVLSASIMISYNSTLFVAVLAG